MTSVARRFRHVFRKYSNAPHPHIWWIVVATWTMSSLLVGCDWMPGRPKHGPEVKRPEEVVSFEILYAQNCASCHGADGTNGPSTSLANPDYQALIDDSTLRDITAHGQKGTMMPGFSLSSGGPLTDKQVDILVDGMRAKWKKQVGEKLPPYAAGVAGDPKAGQAAYDHFCARCHGSSSTDSGKFGSVLDATFLGLISDQVLRTTIIAGRPDLGMPASRNNVPGQPMTDQEVSDVVAWIASHRPILKGQTNPSTNVSTSTKHVVESQH